MKKILLTSVAVLSISAAAHAQNYDKQKGGDHLLQDTRRIEPEKSSYIAPARQPEPVQTVQREEPRPVPVREEEPGEINEKSEFDNFTGFYLGADVGYTLGSYGDVDLDGFEPGVFAGYGFDYDLGDWWGGYMALELAYYKGFADDDVAGGSIEKDYSWNVTARPGVTMGDDALGYGIVGYSRGEFEAPGNDATLDGYVLGAGAQYNTGTAFKPRIEYTYTNYGDENLGGAKFEGHENNIKVGMLFQF